MSFTTLSRIWNVFWSRFKKYFVYHSEMFWIQLHYLSLTSWVLVSKEAHKKRRQFSPPMLIPALSRRPTTPLDLQEWTEFVVSAHTASFTPVSDIFTSRVNIFPLSILFDGITTLIEYFFSRKVRCRLVFSAGSTLAARLWSQQTWFSGHSAFRTFSTVCLFSASGLAHSPFGKQCTRRDGERENILLNAYLISLVNDCFICRFCEWLSGFVRNVIPFYSHQVLKCRYLASPPHCWAAQ